LSLSLIAAADLSAPFLEPAETQVAAHKELWGNGPQIDPRRFARVENAAQVMRSLCAALAMEAAPTPSGEAARTTLLAALAKMR
jgi:hypothetical protein